MAVSLPVYRFVYKYVTDGDLAGETIEVDAITEQIAFDIARRKVNTVSARIGLELVSCEPRKLRRSA